MSISIAIPTYQRSDIALATVIELRRSVADEVEIIVVDQTPTLGPAIAERFDALDRDGSIRWIRLPRPSIPAAMNAALLVARGDIVLFLDDDIVPSPDLVAAHARAQLDAHLIAGQVMQPGETATPLAPGEGFRFNSTEPAWIEEFIGCNFSVKRLLALEIGGFDENFVGAAYRYEAEFAHRFRKRHGPIRFEPAAWINHLRLATGGTRAHGHHLRTIKPAHSVGEYYFLLKTRPVGWLRRILLRPFRAVRTRHHLSRPWWIPVTLLAELAGLVWSLRLLARKTRPIVTS